jgi:hypothetical protein
MPQPAQAARLPIFAQWLLGLNRIRRPEDQPQNGWLSTFDFRLVLAQVRHLTGRAASTFDAPKALADQREQQPCTMT